MQSDEPNEDSEYDAIAFKPARFSAVLGLPAADDQLLNDAAAAVGQEYRDSSRWKRLNCQKVSVFAERDRGTIYAVHIGKVVQFDWTWEGAKAFCPRSLDDDARYSDRSYESADYEDDMVWSGEIVEVDEQNGCLFVALDNPEARPKVGSFFVRPFEFLSVLDSVYNGAEFDLVRERLPERLAAAAGDVHPKISQTQLSGKEYLADLWQHSWSVLWGPPGTGKTWNTGQQIAKALNDSNEQVLMDERVLVVSTTNKATDAVALSIGEAAIKHCPDELENSTLLRIGKGASFQTFVQRELESMLVGTASSILSEIDDLARQLPVADSWEEKALTRKRIGALRAMSNDSSNRIFVDPEQRVVVTTAFKAMSYLRQESVRQMIENGEAPFTTIFIDEAGLISRSTVAALSLLAARRVVLVGDSKQLAPISRITRVLPTRQQKWLASSGVSHLDETDDVRPGIHLLTEQRRMHDDVCDVVSNFQYNGILTTAEDRKTSKLSAFLADTSRVVWYVLDEEDGDLASIRAGRGPGNQSWVRTATEDVLQKLFADQDIKHANGMFISPFKAQAQAIGDLLAQWQMRSWEASTVHSQQGSEADIVVFDTVNASNNTWPITEWKRLVNVAISRAREAVVVLASRAEMQEPFLRPLKSFLMPLCLVDENGEVRWRKVSKHDSSASPVKEQETSYRDKSSNRMGDQFAQRRQMKPIMSQEQQRLTNLSLDGKPRLVRGVAGSGKSVVLCNWLARTASRMAHEKESRIWAVYANRSLHKLLCDSIESAWSGQRGGDLFDQGDFPWEKVDLLHVKDVLSGLLPSVKLNMNDFGFDYDRAAEEFLNRADFDQLLPRCSALFIDEAQDMGPSTLRLLLSVVEQSDAEDDNSRSAHVFYDNAQNVYNTKTPTWSEFGLDMRGRSTIMRESFRSTQAITELAVNVLERLSVDDREDQQELISMGLLKLTQRNGERWLESNFNQVDGPKPIFHRFDQRDEEMDAIARHLRHLVEVEAISPNDICIIYNGGAKRDLELTLAPKLSEFGVELSFQKNRAFERKANTVIATSAHSFKGYESEVVVIPCVDRFVASRGKIVANALYVAMTRARSLLAIYGVRTGSEASRALSQTISDCIHTQRTML